MASSASSASLDALPAPTSSLPVHILSNPRNTTTSSSQSSSPISSPPHTPLPPPQSPVALGLTAFSLQSYSPAMCPRATRERRSEYAIAEATPIRTPFYSPPPPWI